MKKLFNCNYYNQLCQKITLLICLMLILTNISIASSNNFAQNLQPIDVAFSPNGNSLQLILKCINSATKSIHVAAYAFTSKPIAQALLMAAKRGVAVAVVADAKSNHDRYTAVTFLAHHDIQVRLNNKYQIFHNKFMIIDAQTVETGSFNYTNAAWHKNAENVIVIWHNQRLAKAYEDSWQQFWHEATPVAH